MNTIKIFTYVRTYFQLFVTVFYGSLICLMAWNNLTRRI